MRDVPPLITVRSGRGAIFIWLGVAAGAAGLGLLYLFNPAEHGFYPRCFFKMATGLDCPGCGGLRATHQLLHGHLREALALNPLFVLSLPVLAWFAGGLAAQRVLGRKLPQPFRTATWAWLAAAVVIAFGVLRNLPWRAWLVSAHF